MIQKLKVGKHTLASREAVAGATIFICLGLLLITMLAVRLLDVKIKNIEPVDHGLFTVITDVGSVNVVPQDILRIERTYTKAAVTGKPVELDKIYTEKGFIYVSSLDPFAGVARQLIDSVDFDGKPVWERASIQWQSVQPYGYVIGTPENRIPLVFLSLSLQYLAFSVGGIALAVLIFPLRFKAGSEAKPVTVLTGEHEHLNQEETQLGAVAK